MKGSQILDAQRTDPPRQNKNGRPTSKANNCTKTMEQHQLIKFFLPAAQVLNQSVYTVNRIMLNVNCAHRIYKCTLFNSFIVRFSTKFYLHISTRLITLSYKALITTKFQLSLILQVFNASYRKLHVANLFNRYNVREQLKKYSHI